MLALASLYQYTLSQTQKFNLNGTKKHSAKVYLALFLFFLYKGPFCSSVKVDKLSKFLIDTPPAALIAFDTPNLGFVSITVPVQMTLMGLA